MSAPVKHTCPDIDKAVKWVRAAIKDAEYGLKCSDKGSDQHDYFGSIISNIEDVVGMLEDLRKSNEALREWGEGLMEELQSSANCIDELEQKLATANACQE